MIDVFKRNIDTIVLFFTISFLISDFLTSIAVKLFPGTFYRYSGIVKLLFEVVMIVVIISTYKQHKKMLGHLFGLIGLFAISQFLLEYPYDIKKEFLKGNIYFFNRYIYILLFIVFMQSVYLKSDTFNKIYRFFEYFLYINSFAILCGLLFEIELFRSYEYTKRFGYAGLFSKPGEASFMYITAIVCNYYMWTIRKNSIHLYKSILFILFALCIGQKTILLFLIFLSFVHLIVYSKYKKVFIISLPIIFTIIYLLKETIITLVFRQLPFWNTLYKEEGLLAALTSTRNLLLEKAIQYINSNWNFWNYVFGGIDFGKYKVEFELIDVYIFMGISGVIFYFYIIIAHFLKKTNVFKKTLILAVFATSFFSGGLILSVTAIIFFYITVSKIMLSPTVAEKYT